MRVPYLRALRYGRQWVSRGPGVDRTEVRLPSPDGGVFPASVYRPSGPARVRPGWVTLHGITRPGRFHDSLVRFASSLAASGAVVVVPEVEEWVRLELAPRRTLPAVKAGLDYLEADAQVRGRAGLAGFSFGSPQVIRAALHPEVQERLAAVAAFGGYSDLESTLHFQFTGEFEGEAGTTRLRPDPYGRWIVAANYLDAVPGYEEAGAAAAALRTLAEEAGDLQIDSWDPRMDGTKTRLRAELDGTALEIFDEFAPPAGVDPAPDSDTVRNWIPRLVEAARRRDPEIELPAGPLSTSVPIHIVHGENDQLIPVSECRRLAARLQDVPGSVSVTRLFSHSTGDERRGWVEFTRENLRFLRILDRILGSV